MISSGEHEPAQFGFDDDAWIEQLRQAMTRPALGALGRYELIEEISRGGQGVVYRARDRKANRQVAVKRLVAGALATPSTRHRFEREVKAAAALQHANIVTLYDTAVAGGQPLLVMQWIDGVPINEWAAAAPLKTPRSVVEVFVRVCDAVHHAHQRGIIHRDLKPANILVDAAGEPHVLDFGTAKFSGADRRRGLTLSGQFLGTPAYSSPEQVRGPAAGVDVRSDVYALGVVLYELLCGRMPYPVNGALVDVFDAIERAQPPRPSRVAPRVDHELDAILLKTLEKTPARRYQSVEALGRDLQRYLDGRPVEARGTGTFYLLGKAIRRHRLPVTAGVVVAALLLGYAVTMPVLYLRAEHQADRAVMVQEFLQDVLATASPYRLGSDQHVTNLLDEASRRVGREFARQPEAEAAIRLTLGRAYGNLWMWAEAEPQARRAAQLHRAMGSDPARLVACLNLQARALAFRHRREAIAVIDEALGYRDALGGDHPLVAESLGIRGFAYWQTKPARPDAAEAGYDESLAMFSRLGPTPTAEWARTRFSDAMFKLNMRRYDEAETSFLEALSLYEGLHDEAFYTSHCLEGYGELLLKTGRPEQAEAALLRSVALQPEGVATDRLVRAWWLLGQAARREGDPELARQRFDESLATWCEMLAQDHVDHMAELRGYAARLRDRRTADFPHDDVIALLEQIEPSVAKRWRNARDVIGSLQ